MARRTAASRFLLKLERREPSPALEIEGGDLVAGMPQPVPHRLTAQRLAIQPGKVIRIVQLLFAQALDLRDERLVDARSLVLYLLKVALVKRRNPSLLI